MLRQRLDKAALFEDLGYGPHPGQLTVHQSRALRRVIASGTRWGKSTVAVWETIAGMLEPREATRAWLVAPTYELTQRIWRPITKTFHERLAHRIYDYSERELRLVVVNLAGGLSELQAKSADKPAGLLGESLDFVVVDEAARLRDDVWAGYILPRLIDRRGWSLLVSTPKGPGWFWAEFRRGRKNRDPDCESWAMPSATNPFISAEVIEAERKRLPEASFRQEFEAEFLGVEVEPCEACGGPRPDVPDSMNMRDDQTWQSIPTCPKCGMFVDETGLCIVNLWNKTAAGLSFEWEEESCEAFWTRLNDKSPWRN
jgi:hypothetical protein